MYIKELTSSHGMGFTEYLPLDEPKAKQIAFNMLSKVQQDHIQPWVTDENNAMSNKAEAIVKAYYESSHDQDDPSKPIERQGEQAKQAYEDSVKEIQKSTDPFWQQYRQNIVDVMSSMNAQLWMNNINNMADSKLK